MGSLEKLKRSAGCAELDGVRERVRVDVLLEPLLARHPFARTPPAFGGHAIRSPVLMGFPGTHPARRTPDLLSTILNGGWRDLLFGPNPISFKDALPKESHFN